MDEIRNRVQESGLLTLDLADFKPKGAIKEIDIANQLWQGIALKEKEFRLWIKENDWSDYKNENVYIHCSADAIVPTWAYMLVASELIPIASSVLVGSKDELVQSLIAKNINDLDAQKYKDGRIIIKGCSDIPSPEFAMVTLMNHLQPVAKSIMYGEPCSAVPVFKRK